MDRADALTLAVLDTLAVLGVVVLLVCVARGCEWLHRHDADVASTGFE